MTQAVATKFTVRTVDGNPPQVREHNDSLVTERLLEILVNGQPYAQTMRCPGMDDLLVRGLLVADGLVWHTGQITGVQLGQREGTDYADVLLGPGLEVARNRAGTTDAASVLARRQQPPVHDLQVGVEVIRELPALRT